MDNKSKNSGSNLQALSNGDNSSQRSLGPHASATANIPQRQSKSQEKKIDEEGLSLPEVENRVSSLGDYHRGIKKETSLDGGTHSPKAYSGASSDVSDNNIPQTSGIGQEKNVEAEGLSMPKPNIENTSIDINPGTHTAEENRRIAEYKNSVDKGLFSWITKVKNAFAGGDKSAVKMRTKIGSITERQAFKIKKKKRYPSAEHER